MEGSETAFDFGTFDAFLKKGGERILEKTVENICKGLAIEQNKTKVKWHLKKLLQHLLQYEVL